MTEETCQKFCWRKWSKGEGWWKVEKWWKPAELDMFTTLAPGLRVLSELRVEFEAAAQTSRLERECHKQLCWPSSWWPT